MVIIGRKWQKKENPYPRISHLSSPNLMISNIVIIYYVVRELIRVEEKSTIDYISLSRLNSPNTIDPGVMISIDSLYSSLALLSPSIAFITSSKCLASL